MSELHKNGIHVSDIAAQYWCERQMDYNYRYGKKFVTKEIRNGRAIHEALENEVNVPIILQPKGYADALYKNFYSSHMALSSLKENKKAREVQLYGSIGGYRLVGKIDQLEIRDGEVVIVEDKTRASDKIPNEAQAITHRAQVSMYRKMVDDIKSGAYTADNFSRAYRIDTMRITPEFEHQLEALGIPEELWSIDTIARKAFQGMRSLPKVSGRLHIKYINQFTGKEIKLYTFDYDEGDTQEMIKYVLRYWNGERSAQPVPEAEKWKCRFCVFFGKECKEWWPQKAL